MKNNYVISIDMGGTKILTAAVNPEEGIVARVKQATKVAEGKINYPKILAKSVDELLETAGIAAEQVKAVSIGIPGSVNPETGIIGLAPNLGIKNYQIKKELEKHIPFPVFIENDVNLGVLGIHRFGVGKGHDNILAVFIGTGIGGGLIINGKIYRGNTFTAGEIGHMHLVDNGPLCGCGKLGCYEAIASRTAIVREITKDILAGKRSKLSKLIKSKAQIKSKSLSAAVKANDKVVIKHVTNSAVVTGKILAGINNLLNLDQIVLGGGVIEALHGFYMPLIKESFKEYSLRDSSKATKVVVSKLLDDAAIFGGIALAEEYLGITL